MAVGDVYAVQTMLVVDETECTINTAYSVATDGGDNYPAKLLVEAYTTAVKPVLLFALSKWAVAAYTRARRVLPGPETPCEATYDESTDFGQIDEDCFPANIGACFLMQVFGASGRHNGRIFVPGLPESAIENNHIVPTWRDGVGTDLAAALFAPLTPATYIFLPCVIERWSFGVQNDPPIYHNVSAVGISQRPSGIRRRTAKETYVP